MTEFARSIAPALANHIWQSTAFAMAAWVLTLMLRRNPARVRHGIWVVASMKFLLPFSLLIAIGGAMPKPRHPVPAPVYSALDAASLPFSAPPAEPEQASAHRKTSSHRYQATLPILLAAWLCGTVVVLTGWVIRWRHIAGIVHRAASMREGREPAILQRLQSAGVQSWRIPLLLSSELMEPVAFGVVRPVLVWPRHLSAPLDDVHIETILAHELAHVRRRDNLTAALHMLVEALFWFHPMVWWMERRMLEERERACDEAVVESVGNSGPYVEGLLRVCRLAVESPLPCVSGIGGADLNLRVRSILTTPWQRLTRSRQLLIGGLAMLAFAAPVAFGIVRMIPMYGQILHASGPLPSFEVATIKPAPASMRMTPVPARAPSGEPIIHEEVFRGPAPGASAAPADTVHMILTTRMLIGSAYNVGMGSKAQILGGPDWLDTEPYELVAKIEPSLFAAMQKMTAAQRHEQQALMEQSLLADRFKLKVHFETREMPVYSLVVAKAGPKLTPAKQGEATRITSISRGEGAEITALGTTMDQLAHQRSLSSDGRMVVDQTGLKGAYDFTLKWGPQPSDDGAESGADLTTAIQEQLGLKLVPSRAPVEVMVIDHVEPPSQN